MKYSELIHFDAIEEIVKFNLLDKANYRQSLVRDFVFSKTYEDIVIPEICRQLDYTSQAETFGLQIVGNYGTGKSHLMSLFSLIAEDPALLDGLTNDNVKQSLKAIAGKYKVVRFELGTSEELWRVICFQIDKALQSWGINYSIADDNQPDMYKDKLDRMMAQFEVAFPDKGLMIVIDEMLSYLKGRSGSDQLNRDLAVIQALGEKSDRTKFRMVFGVQEMIYKAPEFQFASEMLQKVNTRYRPITITNQDVKFVVQQRLLRKDEMQKDRIRAHLNRFTSFFTDMHANFEDYVNLFPVNPSFFENFQQIKVGNQREVLKTLSKKFEALKDQDVPDTHPGLICYDHYWDDLNIPAMMSNPDVQRVSEIMAIIHQKIDENFIDGRAKKASLAHRIANACAVKILQDNLSKTNGVRVDNLVDDLCYLDDTCADRSLLNDIINNVAELVVSATDGQYFEKNENNQEFHIRIEGGVNYEQKIKDFISTMSDDAKDSHFFNFLVEYLPIVEKAYRSGFNIFRHSINWKSHKTMLDGYIFMGHPSERSTTQPQQNFYIYFMPIFNASNLIHGNEPDSIYIYFNDVSSEMKELVQLYASAEALNASVDSSQKPFYEEYKKRYGQKLIPIFQRDFTQRMKVLYQGNSQPLSPQMMRGYSKEQIISDIASELLENYFCQKLPNHPSFTLLNTPITSNNRDTMLKGARQKIADPNSSNHDGEAILAGLCLLKDNQLSIDTCIYAQSIKRKLDSKGVGQVLNRDEILHQFYVGWMQDWRSNDYDLDADYEFLVLATMVALGEIEIAYPGGKTINAANLKDIINLPKDSSYSFTHLCAPKDMNVSAVRELFLSVLGKDLTSQINNPEIYAELIAQSRQLAEEATKMKSDIANGIYVENEEVLSDIEASYIQQKLVELSDFCDKLPTYASPAKMRNLPMTAEDIKRVTDVKKEMRRIKRIMQIVEELRPRVSYLSQALQYMTEETMKGEVEYAIEKLKDVICELDDEQKLNNYRIELDTLMGLYADWYLGEYNRLHINNFQYTEKQRIINSNEKRVCDIICGVDHNKEYFPISSQYASWTKKTASLILRDDKVTRDAILRSPYQGFNPVQFVGQTLPDIACLREELQNIYDTIDESLHQILNDEMLLANKDILDPNEQQLLQRFKDNGEQLSPNNAERLMEIVGKLHKGINRIEITVDSIRQILNRPMSPEEAIKAFRQYIDSVVGGNNADNNTRIIIK